MRATQLLVLYGSQKSIASAATRKWCTTGRSAIPRQVFRTMASDAKARTALQEVAKDGAFVRTAAGFRHKIEEGGKFEPEPNRYHLYISYACPWACRCAMVRSLKGLEDVIGLSVVHPTWQRTRPDAPGDEHTGWAFADPDGPPFSSSTGKYSVPVLWDMKEKCIVNNESSEILRMFNSEFNKFAKNPKLDLYPEALRAEIDAVNDWVYPTINNGVYRCGFATQQGAYNQAFKELFESLDRVESILSRQRYIAGGQLTEADVRLFVTLIRFDQVYVVYFKTNKQFLHEYPNIREYVKDVHQTPGVAGTVNMYHIKTHYFTSHPKLNYYAIVPQGGDAWWEQSHDRATKFA